MTKIAPQNAWNSDAKRLAAADPFSNDISGLYPKYINIFRATLIISVFCVVSNPWQIIRNASGLLAFLSGYSMFMGAVCGVMCSQ